MNEHPIRIARRARGWTQQRLAEASDVSVVAIKKIEAGTRQPSSGTLRKLAAALEMSMDELAGAPPPTWDFPADALLAAGLPEEEVADLRNKWDALSPLGRRGYRALLLRRAALEAELRDLKNRGGDLKSLVIV